MEHLLLPLTFLLVGLLVSTMVFFLELYVNIKKNMDGKGNASWNGPLSPAKEVDGHRKEELHTSLDVDSIAVVEDE